MKAPYMDHQRVLRFEVPRVGTVVTDGFVLLRPGLCPALPVPSEDGFWRWHRDEWLPLTQESDLATRRAAVRPFLPQAAKAGPQAEPTEWLVRANPLARQLLLLSVDGRAVPVDVDGWDGWVTYLDATFGEAGWRAHQAERNKPVTFWHGRSWCGLLMPVHDKWLPETAPPKRSTGPELRPRIKGEG